MTWGNITSGGHYDNITRGGHYDNTWDSSITIDLDDGSIGHFDPSDLFGHLNGTGFLYGTKWPHDSQFQVISSAVYGTIYVG